MIAEPIKPAIKEVKSIADENTDDDVDDFTEEEQKSISARMDAAGWKTVTIAEFLDLTPEDMAFIQVRRTFARAVRNRREVSGLSRTALAETLGLSETQIALMEGNASSISMDVMLRAFLAMGATQNDLAEALAAYSLL